MLCGNRKLLTEFNVDCGTYDENGAVTTVYISVNGKLAGTIQIADTIKPEAKDAIRSLKSMGIRSAMLTGDGEAAAEAVAAEVGIDNVYAKLLPADKLEILQKLRAENGSACSSVTGTTTHRCLQALMWAQLWEAALTQPSRPPTSSS